MFEDKISPHIRDETIVVKQLRYYINNQKNIKEKLSLLNDKDDLINYLILCQKNINELMLISSSLIQEDNNREIYEIMNNSIDQIYLFIIEYVNNHIDEVYLHNNQDVLHKVDETYTTLLYYFENDIIFDNIQGKEYYINCFYIYIYLLQIGYLITKKKESYIAICTDFSNI